MPIIKSPEEGEAPKAPHLAVLSSKTGLAIGIEPGATVFLVEDARDRSQVYPLLLVKVSRRQIVFRCACQQPQCTRVLKFQLRAEGFHPNSTSVAGL